MGSLFAGIGGFDLAAERAGMEVVWQSEVDKHASRVLDHHWPHVKNLGDIHGIGCACNLQAAVRRQDIPEDGADLDDRWRQRRSKPNSNFVLDDGGSCEGCGRARPPVVDVLTGGFPCQDYSVAGNREGLAGDRGALWWEYHRLIDELRPTWVVGENVPGLLSSRGGADFETIIRSLTECGYGVAWAVLDAQYFGVAQRRRRVFIVGHSGGVPRPEVLALSEGVFGHPEPSRETGEATAALTEASAGGAGLDDQAVARLVAFAQNQRGEVRDLNDLAGALAAEPGMKQQTYVVSPLGAEPTQPTHSVRRLTPLEAERLQGFPDRWTDIPGNSDTQRYRQLGNAVAVPVVEWIMRRIVEVPE